MVQVGSRGICRRRQPYERRRQILKSPGVGLSVEFDRNLILSKLMSFYGPMIRLIHLLCVGLKKYPKNKSRYYFLNFILKCISSCKNLHSLCVMLEKFRQYCTNIATPKRQTDEICEMSFASCPKNCLLYTSPSPRDRTRSRMPSSA